MRQRSNPLGRAAVAALVFIPQLAFAQTGAPLTLEGANARAAANNRAFLASQLQRGVDLAGVDVARQRVNPELSYEYAKETPHQAFSVTLPIETGGKRQRRVALAQATVAVTEADIRRLTIDLRTRVRTAYFAVVAANRRAGLAGDLRALALRARDAAQARFQAGDVARLEVVQTELALADADNDVPAARGERRATLAELNELLAQPAGGELALADDLGRAPLPALEQAQTLAAGSNTELALIDQRLAEQTARRDLARAMQTPDVAAGAAYTFDAQPEFSHGYRFSAGVTIPIFTRYKAAVIVEEAALARLSAERAATLAQVNAAVAAAIERAAAAREQVRRGETETLPRAAEVERMAQDAYASGQSGLVALLQALQLTREVRQRNLDALVQYQAALADLERAIGAPLP